MAQTTIDVNVKDNASKVLRDIEGSLGSIAKLVGAAFGVREVTRAIGAFQDFRSQIQQATNSTQELTNVQGALIKSSTENYRSISESASIFSALRFALDETAYATTAVTALTTTLQASFKLSNTSAQGAAASISALSKSFQTGTVDARSFREITGSTPNILLRLQAATGLSREAILKLGNEGRISAEGLIKALEATEKSTNDLAKTSGTSLNDAIKNVGTQFDIFIGKTSEGSGSLKIINYLLKTIAENMDTVVLVLGGLIIGLTGAAFVKGIANVFLLVKAIRAAGVAAAFASGGLTVIAGLLGVGVLMGAEKLYEKFEETNKPLEDIDENLNKIKSTQNGVVLESTKMSAEAEKFLNELRASLETNERLKEIEAAKAKLGEKYTHEVQKQHEALLNIKKLQEIEKAMPALITETQGAYAGGSTEQKALEEKLKLNRDARELDRISEEEYQSNMLILMEEYAIKKRQSQQQSIANMAKDALAGNISQEKLAKLDMDTRIAVGKSMFGDLLSEASKYSEKAFKANKALALANAVIKGYEAIVSAYASGAMIGGPIVGGIFAALAAIAVKGQINAIRGTQYTGARRQGGLVGENQSYLVGEDGPEMFTPSSSGRITPNDQMGQGVTVNFNISTVDADGFDEILINRRSTIVGIINEATNKRGRVGVTQ